MAVAGDKESRHGIILAKNMLAKSMGVQTAEPIWQAKRKCPGLQLVPPHRERYLQYSRMAQEIYYRFTDQVEAFSLDECWLDVYGSERLFGDGEQIAQQIRRAVKEELGLTVSIGVSYNKVFAKLGSDYKKPDAVTVFGREQMESVIWKLPAQALLFVGPHTEKTLEKFGIHTIGDIARMELPAMRRMLGKTGEALWTYANGLDHSPVAAAGAGEPPKTIGNSTTLPHDVTSEEEVRRVLLELAESVASRLRRQGMKAGEVQLTVKNGDFQEYQRQCRLEPRRVRRPLPVQGGPGAVPQGGPPVGRAAAGPAGRQAGGGRRRPDEFLCEHPGPGAGGAPGNRRGRFAGAFRRWQRPAGHCAGEEREGRGVTAFAFPREG